MSKRFTISRYERELQTVMGRFKRWLPRSACLLVGPSDLPMHDEAGAYVSRPRQAEIVKVQRRVAADLGCGFFDVIVYLLLAMGILIAAVGALGPPPGAGEQPPLVLAALISASDLLHWARHGG